MGQYGFKRAPNRVSWSVQELTTFVKQLHLTPEIECQMLASLRSDVTLSVPDDQAVSVLQYNGYENQQNRFVRHG